MTTIDTAKAAAKAAATITADDTTAIGATQIDIAIAKKATTAITSSRTIAMTKNTSIGAVVVAGGCWCCH